MGIVAFHSGISADFTCLERFSWQLFTFFQKLSVFSETYSETLTAKITICSGRIYSFLEKVGSIYVKTCFSYFKILKTSKILMATNVVQVFSFSQILYFLPGCLA